MRQLQGSGAAAGWHQDQNIFNQLIPEKLGVAFSPGRLFCSPNVVIIWRHWLENASSRILSHGRRNMTERKWRRDRSGEDKRASCEGRWGRCSEVDGISRPCLVAHFPGTCHSSRSGGKGSRIGFSDEQCEHIAVVRQDCFHS